MRAAHSDREREKEGESFLRITSVSTNSTNLESASGPEYKNMSEIKKN